VRSRRERDAENAGCLYDGSVEVQTFTPAELAAVEAAAAEVDPRELRAGRFRVITTIRSQNFNNTPKRRMRTPLGIVLHHTGGRFAGDLATLTKPAKDPANSVSANDYIAKDGRIFELCEYPKRAWHAGRTKPLHGLADWNAHGWGIELENRARNSDPYPRVQIEALVWRCRERRRRFGISDPKMVTRHRDISREGKIDPLDNFPYGEVRRRIFAKHDPTDEGTHPLPTQGEKVTVSSRLVAPARVDRPQAAKFLTTRPHGTYSSRAVRHIVDLYFDEATAVGVDPLLVIAQMVLETGGLTSDWSQPPRRNPAGIGVTGQPNKGVSFPNWRSAVRAHVGRLAAYALSERRETAAQEALIDEALSWRPLPDSFRGIAPRLSGLAGSWAKDRAYARKIAAVANDIRKVD
jgi:N-acetyl-anhydromuramyl-L-alanine amidase AmpD